MRLIDTHCHLADKAFEADLPAVIERARETGLEAALVMGEDLDENRRILALCGIHPFMQPCLGHYPSRLDLSMAEASAALIRHHATEIAGIGEVGLDYRITDIPGERLLQRRILTLFAGLSNETGLTLSVHSRSAGHHTIDLLVAEEARSVVMHAFDGKASHARRAVERGFYFSIPPSIVRSRQKQKLVRALPLDRLLLESDAPVLGPDPEKRNEPALIIEAARCIAEIAQRSLEEVAAVTTRNARRLFAVHESG